MEKDKVIFFLVLEQHMLERYSYTINKYNFKFHCFNGFDGLQIGFSLNKIIKRVSNRQKLFDEYKILKQKIYELQKSSFVESIYLSNSEGYIANNIISRLKRDFPEIELIGLQHGIFDLRPPSLKILRKVINYSVKFIFKIFPIGVGFGEKIVDKYIVYNDRYRDFLINEMGWGEKEVISDINFLKSELVDKKKRNNNQENTALFLLQGLSISNLCSEEDEKYLNDKVIRYLINIYDKVYVKNHPSCKEVMINNIQSEKVSYIDNLIEGFNKSKHAYSFNSTTLIEAEIFDVKSFAINSVKIKDSKSIYNIFQNVINFEEVIDN